MVIDKWIRSSSNNNNSLITPLLGHKSKESFIELKNSYEKLKALNHRFKKWKKSPIQKSREASTENEILDIKDYLEQINLILISIDDLVDEENNYELDEGKTFDVNKKNNIYDDISSECVIFIEIMKDIKKDKNAKNNFDINSSFNKCKITINNINKKIKIEKSIENITFGQEQSNQSLININPNIDRGQINIFSRKREFNNSIIIEQNNVQFSLEQESLNNSVRLILFCFGICFLLFICYLCMP